jgi:hypothetical protein
MESCGTARATDQDLPQQVGRHDARQRPPDQLDGHLHSVAGTSTHMLSCKGGTRNATYMTDRVYLAGASAEATV